MYDKENELDNRLSSFSNLDQSLFKELQDVMEEVNPYAQKYSHVGDIIKQHPREDIQLVLKATKTP